MELSLADDPGTFLAISSSVAAILAFSATIWWTIRGLFLDLAAIASSVTLQRAFQDCDKIRVR